jgi:hypothetical protein
MQPGGAWELSLLHAIRVIGLKPACNQAAPGNSASYRPRAEWVSGAESSAGAVLTDRADWSSNGDVATVHQSSEAHSFFPNSPTTWQERDPDPTRWLGSEVLGTAALYEFRVRHH